jgi:iron complex outermembrane receptor protein
VADLNSEKLVSAELGFKSARWSAAAFVERQKDFIFRDAAGLNVSNGKTQSRGVELSVNQGWNSHSLELALSYAKHRYDFDGGASGGEVIVDGNYIDTAPRWLGNARWRWVPTAQADSEVEVVFVGEHEIDAANTAEYDGHVVFNWRGSYALSERASVFARVINLLDKSYADRADFTVFNPLNYRYFPAMPRQLYLGVTFDF